MIRVRGFQLGDLEDLAALDRLCFEPGISYTRSELRFHVTHPGGATFVAESDGRLSGFIVGRAESATAGHVITIDVFPDARRKGVGTALLSALHEDFSARQLQVIYLEVDRSNLGAGAFYRGLGYTWLETLEDYYGPGRDADRLVCVLDPDPSISTASGGKCR